MSGAVTVTLEEAAVPPPAGGGPDTDQESRIAVAGSLATGMTVLVAALGLFGGLTGAVARLARNHPGWTAIAVGAVIVSVMLAVTARLVATGAGGKRIWGPLVLGIGKVDKRPYVSTAMLWVSAVLLAVGLLVAVCALTQTINQDDRPSVSAEVSRTGTGLASISGTAKAGGLAATDAIRVVLVAYAEGDSKGTQSYYAVVGPSPDGVVEHEFTVILPSGTRSVVVTAGKEVDGRQTVRGQCKPEEAVDAPVDPTDPNDVGAGSRKNQPHTACALVLVPDAPAAAPTSAGDADNPAG